MKKLQEYILSGLPLPEGEDCDPDVEETELKEWSDGNTEEESAAGEETSDVIKEDAEVEREAISVLRKNDSSLYGMSKGQAKEALKKCGYSDSRIKNIESHKESLINKKMKEIGMEFPGANATKGNSDDRSLDNIYDGSPNGFDSNIEDVCDQMDPNSDMEEPLYGVIKPYDTAHQTQPASLDKSGMKGYKGSIPSYTGMNQIKQESINIRKLIDRAIEKGWTKKQIKEMLEGLKKK